MEPKFFVLHVEDMSASVGFYTDLLGLSPENPSPTFAPFSLSSGVLFGLWQRSGVEPAVEASACSVELCFPVNDRKEVEQVYADWRSKGLRIAQEPVEMDFGYTFTALDADGHRLRVIAESE